MAIDLDVHGNTKPLEAAVQAAINRIRRKPIKVTVDDKGATQPLGNMKRAADEFSKSMEAANARILAFGASMAIINGVADAFKGMVRNLVEVEKSLADINVVMGLSTQNLDKFGDGLFKVAKETGAAFRVAADAATEYARQGLSMEESLKRTRDALILTRLTGMDSAEAVKSLTAAMNTYGNQIKDTTQLVSKFAAVDVQFAVSAEDFAAAISRTGQAAKTAGVDIDELIGIVTSAQQQTARGGAVIGNALKTIFTKTGRTDTLNQLEDLGIAVRDLEGNTIGAKRILTDLANTFDTLSEAQKSQITQTMGGLFHINILKAVLSDAAKQNGILARATEISSSATDEAVQKNQQLRETMSAMATETGLAIKQVSAQIGEIALAPGMEKILNTVKSLAEGLSGVLGDGEGIGNKFATGFLKGVGNIITGPGLVVLTTVFVKLFMTAAKFTKESLSSLIGVTTEAQKQKAIQTSLVALIGQNAALGKELLRTDITRTEKEKILLGLLQAQTAEANKLNAISKQLASTLYTRGYGPGLTTGKRRAYGHIPNYADPERAQAARGGYAAGSIRTMNMPGEGSVIYNSAETVKNFAGFKQPAIMPPQSSKAGKNYQQAFGSIHGFDPYAAGGYIPNFSRYTVLKNSRDKGLLTGVGEEVDLSRWKPSEVDKLIASGNIKKTTLSFTSDLASIPLNLNQIPLTKQKIKDMGVLLGQGGEGLSHPTYSQTFGSLPKEARSKLLPYMKSIRGKKYGLKKMPDKNSDHWKRKVQVTLPTKAVYAVSEDDAERMEKAVGADTLKATLKRSIGSGFDKFSSKIGQKLFGSKSKKSGINVLEEHVLSDGSALGALFEAGVRGALNNKALTGADQQRAFDFMGDNAQRLSDKFMGIGKRYYIEAKKDLGSASRGDIPKKVLNAAAKGFIPNFADPLSDAIGREKAAGVPVSQIRVGSHNALISKGNPLGLGVTNTHDEPNGLRDVFGANGFVPNYAFNPLSLLTAPIGNKDKIKKLNEKISKQEKAIEEHTRALQQNTNNAKKQERAQRLLTQTTNQLQKSRAKLSSMSLAGRTMGGLKNMGQGMGGMGLMMGLPMLAGFIPGADKPGSAGGIASGMMSGAATGASLGMIFPGWGTAIGAAVGALGGLVSSLNSSKKAINEEKQARIERAGALGQSLAQTFYEAGSFEVESLDATKTGRYADLQKALKNVPTRVVGRKSTSQGVTDPGVSVNQPAEIIAENLFNLNKQRGGQYFGDISKEDIQKFITNKLVKVHGNKSIRSGQVNQQGLLAVGQKYMQNINDRTAVLETLRNLPEGYKFEQDTILTEEERKKGLKPKRKMFSGPEYADELLKLPIEEFAAAIAQGKDAVQLFKDRMANLKEKEAEAIITRLNKESMMLSAQEKFNVNMNASANLLADMKNTYDFELRTRGHLMTEQEKAMNAYNMAVQQSAATRYEAEEKLRQAADKSAMDLLTGKDLKEKFENYLTTKKISDEQFGQKSLEEKQQVALDLSEGMAGVQENVDKEIINQNENLRIQIDQLEEVEKRTNKRAKTEQDITNELIRQQTGPGSFGRGMEKGFADMNKQVARMDYELGKKIPYAFADGLANAMTEALNGTKDIKDALRDAGITFLQMIQQAMMQKAAYSIVGAMGFSQGGNVRNYSRGGGVPAMVSNGEYVMGRDAVAKYGGSFMHSLNAGGKIPAYSNGGKLADKLVNVRREKVHVPGGAQAGSALASGFGGGEGYVSGRKYQNKAMSGYFYSQSGNVGLEEDAIKMSEIIQERNERQEKEYQDAMEKYQKKMQLVQTAVGIAISAGISWGAGKFGQAGKKPNLSVEEAAFKADAIKNPTNYSLDELGMMGLNPDGSIHQPQTRWNKALDYASSAGSKVRSLFGFKNKTYGGPIRKYASGGYISGKSGIDQIPAMLSEGEYVIRASSARQLGKPMLDRINAGKFNEGGAVSELMGSSETAASGGNTNNISISINMERGSGSKQETQKQDSAGQNPADRSNEEQNSSALAERIKQQVVAVIAEEQRPGGLLSD